MNDNQRRPERADSNRRDSGPVRVLRPGDLANCGSPQAAMERMAENRFEIFIHNMAVLCKRYNLSQSELCSQRLNGIIAPSKLSYYKTRGRDIPLSTMTLVANAFHLTVEEMCGQLLDEEGGMEEGAQLSGRPLEEYMKYVGTYDLTYFDSSAPIGQNTGPTEDALSRGVCSVYTVCNAIGLISFHVTAIFRCTPEERREVTEYTAGLDMTKGAGEVRRHYERAASAPQGEGGQESRLKYLYDGDIHLTDHMVEITLRQVRGSDIAHLLAHNRAASSSDGKKYRGGLATMMSVSRGAEHMPCVQAVLLMRAREGKAPPNAPQCRLDYYQPELLASKLYLAPPAIRLDREIEAIIQYTGTLFQREGDGSVLSEISEEDKKYCLKTFVEKKLTEALRRNIVSYYKVALQMDSDFYAMMQQSQ